MGSHVLGLFYLGIILIGPLPLCLFVVNILREREDESSFSFGLLIILTCWCILQTSIELILGMVHHLALGPVILIEILLFLIGFFLLLPIKYKMPSLAWETIWKSFTDLTFQEKLVVGIIAFFGVILLMNFMVSPISDFDSLAFHLPTMAEWYQTGTLAKPGIAKQLESYPYNWQVLCILFMMPFQEDFLVIFPNLMAWGLLGLCVYLLSKKMGAKRIHALAASSLVMMLPIVLWNVNTMHVDIAFASFFLASTYFLICYAQTKSIHYLPLFIGAIGMFLGIKYSGIVYAAVLTLILASFIFKAICNDKGSQKSSFKDSKSLVFFIWASLSFLLLGVFWYLRNLIELGNPLGVLEVQIGNILIFPGPSKPAALYKTTLANLFDFTNLSHWKVFWGQIKYQLGAPFLAMVTSVLLFLYIPISVRSSRKKAFMVLIALLFVTLCLYWTNPYSGDNGTHGWNISEWTGQAMRYAFPFIGILGVVAAVGLTTFQVRGTAIIALVLISSFPELLRMCKSFDITWNEAYYIAILIVIICGIGRLWDYKKWRASVLVGMGFMILVMLITYTSRERRDYNRDRVYGRVVKYIEDNIRQDEVIGFVYSYRRYLFYGKRLNRKVVHIPADGMDQDQWLSLLKTKDIDVIANGPLFRGTPEKVTLWLDNPNGPFVRIFEKKSIHDPSLYRIKD